MQLESRLLPPPLPRKERVALELLALVRLRRQEQKLTGHDMVTRTEAELLAAVGMTRAAFVTYLPEFEQLYREARRALAANKS